MRPHSWTLLHSLRVLFGISFCLLLCYEGLYNLHSTLGLFWFPRSRSNFIRPTPTSPGGNLLPTPAPGKTGYHLGYHQSCLPGASSSNSRPTAWAWTNPAGSAFWTHPESVHLLAPSWPGLRGKSPSIHLSLCNSSLIVSLLCPCAPSVTSQNSIQRILS